MNLYRADVELAMRATATTGSAFGGTLTIKSLEDTKRILSELNAKSDWLMVGPNGQMYKGSPQDMMRVLIQYHPLMQPIDESKRP
jgi:hypothetical protein